MEVVVYQEEFVRNSRGVRLFTCSWLPSSSSPKALVFLCHGYGMECSNFMREVGMRLAAAGYGVYGVDYEGHGKSGGARCYIKKFDNLVADCDRFFKHVLGKEEYSGKGRFLYGESMGGAVALLLHKKDPTFWDGAVLVAPMCKISEKVKPHPVVINLLTKVEEIIPKWKIVPTKDVIDSAFKDPAKREEIRGNKLIYQDKPRLKTALEMLRTSMDLEDSLAEVTLQFLVLHGEADTVTDPEVSRALYEQASSGDKTMKSYPGMWHGLTSGEPDGNVELVFADIVSWLDKRADVNRPVSTQVESSPAIEASARAPLIELAPRQQLKGGRQHHRAPRSFCVWKGHSAMILLLCGAFHFRAWKLDLVQHSFTLVRMLAARVSVLDF